MISVITLRFLIILLAMLAAGIFGYFLARYQARQAADIQLSIMSAEIMKARRRTSRAEEEAGSAHARLSRSRRKFRRRA